MPEKTGDLVQLLNSPQSGVNGMCDFGVCLCEFERVVVGSCV
jgi:hypothetical protein